MYIFSMLQYFGLGDLLQYFTPKQRPAGKLFPRLLQSFIERLQKYDATALTVIPASPTIIHFSICEVTNSALLFFVFSVMKEIPFWIKVSFSANKDLHFFLYFPQSNQISFEDLAQVIWTRFWCVLLCPFSSLTSRDLG